METRSIDVNNIVPDHIRELKAYVPGKTIEEVIRQYNPDRISKLASNENRFGCSPKALEKMQECLATINNYPDSNSGELKARLAEKHDIPGDHIIIGAGSESLIAMITRAFFREGETALTADATFVGFPVCCRINGVRVKQIPVTRNYSFDLPKMAEALTQEVKLVYLANPNNPTGTYFTQSEFKAFMEQVPPEVLVVLDEAYFEFAHGEAPEYPDGLTYDYPNLIVLRTFSKAYGLAGFRIGYGFAHPDVVTAMSKTKLVFEPSAPAQYAALGALEDDEFLERSCNLIKAGRERLYGILDRFGIPYVPSYANAVLAAFPGEEQAKHFTDEMLKYGVILRRLPGFGLPDCVRITVGLDEEIDHFEETLEKVYSR